MITANVQLQGDSRLLIGCAALCLAILAVDLAIPLGVAGGVPYVAVVLFALRARDSRFPIIFACISTALTLLGLLYSKPGGIYWMVIANRGLALFAIWATAIVGLFFKRTQQELLESEQRFELMADQAPIMIWSTGPDFEWKYLNKGWLNFTGRAPELELGDGWQRGIHEQDRDNLCLEYREACEQLKPFHIESRIQCADGKYRWVLIHGAPHFLRDGKLAGLIGTCLDINDRKAVERELEIAREKYFHQEKMAAIDSLAAGMIHEIGNPIAGISGLVHKLIESENATEQTKRDDKGGECLEMIQEQLERLKQISQDIMGFSTVRSGDMQLQSVNDMVSQTCRLMEYDERMAAIDLELCLDSSLPAIELTADHFVQLLLRILFNAVEACNLSERRSRIIVSTRAEQNKIVITVDDNGCSVSPEVLQHHREVFFPSNSANGAREAGLALCQSIVSGYGGYIQIDSKAGEGNTVQVFFPMGESG